MVGTSVLQLTYLLASSHDFVGEEEEANAVRAAYPTSCPRLENLFVGSGGEIFHPSKGEGEGKSQLKANKLGVWIYSQ